jgi:hypothetical protein
MTEDDSHDGYGETSREKNLREGLTRTAFIEYHSTCMAMLLMVASTEATDPTRESAPFSSTVIVTESLSMRVRGGTRGVAEEVRVGESLITSRQHGTHEPDGTYRVHINWRRR